MRTYSDEFLEYLEKHIDSLELEIISDDQFLFNSLCSNFPLGFNRLDWDRIPQKIIFRTLESDRYKCDLFHDHIKPSWEVLEKMHQVSNSDLVYILSDNAIRYSIVTFYKIFKEISEELFKYPQHHYIVDNDFSWCYNVTFEEEIFFGLSINNKKTIANGF